jgi:hypothetical protein
MYVAESRRYRCEHQREQEHYGDVGAAQHRHAVNEISVPR